MPQIDTAVILAAGRGIRLEPVTAMIPKAFLRIGSKSIIEESIEKLALHGIRKIIIVVGHLSESFSHLHPPDGVTLQLVNNLDYHQTGTLHSLLQAEPIIKSDFLLIESDLIYEQRILNLLLTSAHPDLVAVSGATKAGDEVFVEVEGDRITALSKVRTRLSGRVIGEFVGISKISLPLLSLLKRFFEEHKPQSTQFDYETHGLVHASRTHPVRYHLALDLKWSEIDDLDQLIHARSIYPMIQAYNSHYAKRPEL